MEQTNQELVNTEMRDYIENLVKEMAIKNYKMDISAGTTKGDNYLGLIAKVLVAGEDKNGKSTALNFIVKSAPTNELYRTFTPIRLSYEREIYIYREVFPTLTTFQEERGILNPFKSFAKYYASTMKDCNEALILEDMKALGFDLCNRHKPLNYNHAMLVIREYGKLHALSYALRDQQPELFEKLSNNLEDTFLEKSFSSELTKKFLLENAERALNSLDPVNDKVAYSKFNHFQDNMLNLMLNMVKIDAAGKFGVICHGDCWINNILFKYQDSTNRNEPSELCLLDWQLSRLGSPALDLSYFMFTCTDKKLRDDHYDEMIQEYYKSLSSFLRELGSDPEEMFPFDVLQEHLKKFSLFGLYLCTSVLGITTSEVEEVPDIYNMQDDDMIQENFLLNAKNEGKYFERIRDVMLDFVKFGYDV